MVSEKKLELTIEEKKELVKKLIKEQIIDQRDKLRYWKNLTRQACQIDTGYIAQHLVSLITSIPGESMRGKGKDLIDGSEIKSANFLDSLDKKGAIVRIPAYPDTNSGFIRTVVPATSGHLVEC